MSVDALTGFIDAVRDGRLLEPAQADELVRLQASFAEPRALAAELIRRAWLTPYQVNQLMRGRASELLLGSYVLMERLGEGGMGQVFKARNWKLGRVVALKLIRKERLDNPDAVRRFHREIRAAAQLEHPNIVRAFDADEVNGTHLLVMEYVQGTDLARLVRERGPLPVDQACECCRQAALGLQHAHERGLVHRDIKPHNLLLTAGGVVKILDMGLARLNRTNDDEASGTMTREGAVMGTLDYISPEQAMDSHDVDIRADLYSLGCTLYFLLAGRPPFPGGEALQKLLKHRLEEPAPVEQLRPDARPAVAAVVRKLMAKRPEDRFQTPAEAAEALVSIASGAGPAGDTVLVAGSPGPAAAVDQATAPTTAGWSAVAADRTTEQAPPPKRRRQATGRSWRWIAVGCAVGVGILGLGLSAIILAMPGPPVPAATAPPRGDSAAPGGAKPTTVIASPLDKLDPAQIPAAERFDWQPKELVAVLGEHRQRHWGTAFGVTVSRDGTRIATCGMDGMIRSWDPTTLQEKGSIRVLPEGSWIWSLALSPDGKRLAVPLGNGIGIYDLSAAEPARERTVLEGGGGEYSRLAFTPDGKRLFGSDGAGALNLWDLTNGQRKPFWKRTIFKSTPPFAVAQDGHTVAGFTDTKTATLLDISAAEPQEMLAVPLPAEAYSLALSSDGKRLAVGFLADHKIRVWGVSGKTAELEDEIDCGMTIEPQLLRFSPDGKRLAAADNGIRFWDFERKAWGVFVPTSMGAGLYDFGFTPDGQTLIEVNGRGAVRFWALSGETSKEQKPVESSTYLTSQVAFSPDGKRLAAADVAGFGWWDLDRASPAKLREAAGRCLLAVSPDGKQLLLGYYLSWCDLTSDELKEGEGYGQVQDVVRYRLLPDGKTVLAGTNRGEVLFLERGEKQKLVERSRFRAGDGQARLLEVSPDGRMFATLTDSDFAVKLWDLTSGKPELREELLKGRQIYHIQFSADGRQFAVSDTGGQITVWDVQNHPAQQRRQWQVEQALAVAFSPDGRTLATAGIHGKLALRDIETGETRREWQLPGQINYVTYSPDGRHLLTINGNGTGYILRLAPPPLRK